MQQFHRMMKNLMMRLFPLAVMAVLETGSFLFRDVPSTVALPIIRPALGRQHSISDQAKEAMQGYLNHFLSNIDIVISRESEAIIMFTVNFIIGQALWGTLCYLLFILSTCSLVVVICVGLLKIVKQKKQTEQQGTMTLAITS